MLTIDDYCDSAKARNNFKSDRQLSFAVGVSQPSLHQYRSKRAWPSDNTMIRLAILGDLDPKQALLYLNVWRNEGSALDMYIEIAREYLRDNAHILEMKQIKNKVINKLFKKENIREVALLTINEYLDEVKDVNNIETDEGLKEILRIPSEILTLYREDPNFLPNDKGMEDIAKKADMDRSTALILLKVWEKHGKFHLKAK